MTDQKKESAPVRGRPTHYKPEYDQLALRACLAFGAIEVDLAKFFDVSPKTIQRWARQYPSFAAAANQGRAMADANVASRLYARAIGYEHKVTKVFGDPKTQQSLLVETTERFAPDTTACIFWLKNRQPALWRDRAHLDITNLDTMSDEQLAEIAAGRSVVR